MRLLALSVCCLVVVGCNNGVSPNSGPPGASLGESCADANCRKPLVCVDATKTCQGAGTAADGDPCSLGVECQSGVCAPNGPKGKCGPAGMGTLGANCKGDGDCAKTLKCGFDGESLFPKCVAQGTKDVNKECKLGSECAQGLSCISGACGMATLTTELAPNGIPPFVPTPGAGWTGAKCPAAATGTVHALWELPRANDADEVKQDFYRLPFPNDALRNKTTGRVDYSRHPKDPSPPFGFDALGRYLTALETAPFGSSPTVYMRFDNTFDFGTIDAQGADPRLRVVDLTNEPSRFGRGRGLRYFVTTGGNRYICPNYLAVRPFSSDPMPPGVYGVVLKRGVKDGSGRLIEPSNDFLAMLQASPPSDPAQREAYETYAPLRQYLSMQMIPVNDVLTATVFTVGDNQVIARALAAAEAAAAAPTAGTWVKCGGAMPSPCPDVSGQRACGTSTSIEEWHALVDIPIYQEGTAPYLTPSMGGAIDAGAVVRRERVCAALTVPVGAPPDGGWPLVLYAHGTGGNFRSHAGDGAGAVQATFADGGVVKVAMLGFDQNGHGPRRGMSTETPENIVFNFANPAAARGMMLQGGADLHAFTRYAKALGTGVAPELPKLDSSRLVFWGHSQGATEGGLFLGYDRSIDGALMSGASASLTDALLTKKAPINIADAMWIAMSESAPSSVNVFHPVLSLLQMYIDPADPLVHARRVVSLPAEGTSPAFARHVFQPWGKGDLFTSSAVQSAFAGASGLAFIGPQVEDFNGAMPVTSAQGNVSAAGVRSVTAAMRQYEPNGYDGHFVVFNNPSAKTDAVRFMGRVIRGETPLVPEP